MTIQPVTTRSNTDIDQPTRSKLTDAAQQFEGMLLQEMLKPLQSNNEDGGWSSGDKESDSGTDTINSFGVEAVAKAISQSGGFGIARQVIQQVKTEHEKSNAVANDPQHQKT